MSQVTPPHIGKLYEPDSPFFVRWNRRQFSVFMRSPGPRRSPRGHNTPTPPDEWINTIFRNCAECGSCGPVYLHCACGGMYIHHEVNINFRDFHHMIHPILWAYEANKPCRLPNDPVEFGHMYLEQQSAPTESIEAPFPDMNSIWVDLMAYTIQNRQNMRTDVSRTHEMVYIDNPNNNDERPYAIIGRIE